MNVVSFSDGPSYSRRLSDLECEKCPCQWIFESPFPGMFNVNDSTGSSNPTSFPYVLVNATGLQNHIM